MVLNKKISYKSKLLSTKWNYRFLPFAWTKRDQTLRIKVLKNRMIPQNIAIKLRMVFLRTRNTLRWWCYGLVFWFSFGYRLRSTIWCNCTAGAYPIHGLNFRQLISWKFYISLWAICKRFTYSQNLSNSW